MAQVAGEAIRVAAPVGERDVSELSVSPARQRALLVLGVFGLVALLSLVYVSLTSAVASAGFEVGTLESARDYWKLQNDQLSLQVSEARSLATVEREGKLLGMGPPEHVIYLQVAPTPVPSVQPASPAVPEPSPSWTDDLATWLRGQW